MLTLELDELFPRSVEAGGSQGFCGALDIVAIVKPLTPGEDAVLAWCIAQDGSFLVEVSTLPDGRDLFLLRRLHTKQTLQDAIREQALHLEKSLRARVSIAT